MNTTSKQKLTKTPRKNGKSKQKLKIC